MSQVLTADVCPNAPRSTPPTSETALFEAAKALCCLSLRPDVRSMRTCSGTP